MQHRSSGLRPNARSLFASRSVVRSPSIGLGACAGQRLDLSCAELLHVCRTDEILRPSLEEIIMTRRLDRFLERTHIAYFSMEIAIRPEMHTYSGGLGVLSGDSVRSCADLEIPIVFVTLVSHAGCFRQEIDGDDRQIEQPDWWDPAQFCEAQGAMVALDIGS